MKPIPLSRATLRDLDPRIAVPAYDPAAVTAGIVHLGLGGFHRAHMARYTHALMNGAGDALRWGIVGVCRGDLRRREFSRLARRDRPAGYPDRQPDGNRARLLPQPRYQAPRPGAPGGRRRPGRPQAPAQRDRHHRRGLSPAARGEGIDLLALAVAAWLRRARGVDEAGATIDVRHPIAALLREKAIEGGGDPRALLGIEELFGAPGRDEVFAATVGKWLASLYAIGAAATLAVAAKEGGF